MLLKTLNMNNWLKKLMPLIQVDLLKETNCDFKVRDIGDKIPSTTNLATTTVYSKSNEVVLLLLLLLKLRIRYVKHMLVLLSKELTMTQKFVEIEKKLNPKHNKFITTQESSKLMLENFEVRLTLRLQFFSGVGGINFIHPSCFKKTNLISILLYTIVKQSI